MVRLRNGMGIGLLTALMLLCLFAWNLVAAQRAHAAPNQELGVALSKTVGTTPDVCATTTQVSVAPGGTVYVCYTLTNTGTVAIDPLDLIDNFDTNDFQPVTWIKPPGFLLQPGETLTPTSANGLIRPITVVANQSTYAGWGVSSADGSLQQQVLSNRATISVVTLGMTATLGVSATAGATAANCAAPAVTLTSYSNKAYLCITLTNGSSISLTNHLISIPGFGINNLTIVKPLGPSGTTNTTVRITNADNAALAASLTAPTLSSRAYVTSTADGGSLAVSAATEPVVVTGPSASVSLQKTVNTDPVSCGTATALNNVAYGQIYYYCVVLINTSVVTFTNHTLTEKNTDIAASFNLNLVPSARISVTANVLTGTLGISSFLGPFEAKSIVNSTMYYTATNPTLGYRATASASSAVNIITPTPTVTRGPTATNTPILVDTLTPTPSLTPVPATPTPTWTWTPSPTFTPPPTVLIFSTPGGLAPTPYPAIPGIQGSAPGSPFVSPLDPFAATATAQAFAFPTPIIDPVGATMTAQAVFGFPTPILDPYGATLTAQAQFAFPTPIIDPVGATMTAQVQMGFPTPILDPYGATMTAQAMFGFPTPLLDPFGATQTAQSISPLATPIPEQVGVPPTGVVITVTATSTAEQVAVAPGGPTQRPIEVPTAAPSGGSGLDNAIRRSFFVQVLDSAGATLALLWFLGGSVLFFVTAGVLAGLAFRDKERARYDLDAGGDQSAFTAQPLPPPNDKDEWPESLP
jgi:hypothetical protein